MSFPFVIDNLNRCLADASSELLEQSVDRPFDIATAYFSISSYRIVKDGLHKLGAFRLLLGTDQQSGVDLGLKVQGGSSPGPEARGPQRPTTRIPTSGGGKRLREAFA
jgi:hypothetical protein